MQMGVTQEPLGWGAPVPTRFQNKIIPIKHNNPAPSVVPMGGSGTFVTVTVPPVENTPKEPAPSGAGYAALQVASVDAQDRFTSNIPGGTKMEWVVDSV